MRRVMPAPAHFLDSSVSPPPERVTFTGFSSNAVQNGVLEGFHSRSP